MKTRRENVNRWLGGALLLVVLCACEDQAYRSNAVVDEGNAEVDVGQDAEDPDPPEPEAQNDACAVSLDVETRVGPRVEVVVLRDDRIAIEGGHGQPFRVCWERR